jgi:hypothetical protein
MNPYLYALQQSLAAQAAGDDTRFLRLSRIAWHVGRLMLRRMEGEGFVELQKY